MDINIHLVWVAVSAALVFFMQAGFGLLECGSTRAKNAVNVILKNYSDACFSGLLFWLFGYGLMFGDALHGVVGGSRFAPDDLSNADFIGLCYQTMFAATATTIVSGAVAERIRYWPYIVVSCVITGLIYPVFGMWVWNPDGWLGRLGFIDFAGSTVVHSVGAWCALAGVLTLGPRLGRFSPQGEAREIPGHSLPMIALGGFILWLGWFGFNGGSVASVDENLGLVILNTHLGACAGTVGAMLGLRLIRSPLLMTATVNGSIAGLVAITAGAAHVRPAAAVLIGLVGGLIYVLGSRWLCRRRVDDVVDAVAVHGFAGAWGTVATGVFHAAEPYSAGRIGVQLLGVVVAFVWTFGLATLCFRLIDRLLGLRASTQHEQRGLDITEHYELGYSEFQRTISEHLKGAGRLG